MPTFLSKIYLKTFMYTIDPYRFLVVDSVTTVREVVTTLVNIAMITKPHNIHTIANNRPGTPRGAMSPYL